VIAVIQCASRKRANAAYMQTPGGQRVTFVANPRRAPASNETVYAHPDDESDYGGSWRDALRKYNENPASNPFRLLPAWRLYDSTTYGRLVDRFGVGNVFILSAGWGLIRGDFLTPYYDITFSASADPWKRRRQNDRYRDFTMPDSSCEEIVFFGGKEYLPLFCRLTQNAGGQRIVFYNSSRIPDAPGCTLRRFETRTRTNWHYECASAFTSGYLNLS